MKITDEKKVDDNLLKNKIINYFNETYPQTLTEVRNYCNIDFSDYSTILNKPNYLKNFYYPWKRNCFKFKFYSIFKNTNTKDDLPFLRHTKYLDDISEIELTYDISIIFASDFHLNRISQANNWFIDSTYIHLPDFYQVFIFMYLDNINFIYVPGAYAIMNNKKSNVYYEILMKIKNLITCNNKYDIKANTITLDFEQGLKSSVKKVFPDVHIVWCLFHYKQALRKQLSTLGLFKSEYKLQTEEVLKICGKFTFVVNNNNEFNKIINNIEKNILYKDFIKYFKNQ